MERPTESLTQQDGGPAITLTIDSRLTSRDAALRAAYWFSKHLSFEFPPSGEEHTFQIVIRPKALTLDDPVSRSLSDLVAEFRNALVDSELRVRIQQETSSLRELILAKAFAEAGVLEDSPPGSFSDPVISNIELESEKARISHKK